MTGRRAPLGLLMIALAAMPGHAALAQTAPGVDAPSAAQPSQPQSPTEEAARRVERLDALFADLALADNDAWEAEQTEIWAIWSQSGSASMDLLLARATRAMESQDYDLSLRFLNDLVRLAPDFAEGWNKRATVHFLRGDYGNSVADIQRTLALEPRHFGAISGLGIILERLGDKQGAMAAFRRGLEINPHLPGAREAVDRLSPDVDGRAL